MKLKQIIASIGLLGALVVPMVVAPQAVVARPDPGTGGSEHVTDPDPPEPEVRDLKCSVLPQSFCNSAKEGELRDSGTFKILTLLLRIMTAGVGIIAVGALGYAGFLYATAGGSAEQTKKSKDMIRNTIIGIVAYGLMFILLNFLIPGGVLG